MRKLFGFLMAGTLFAIFLSGCAAFPPPPPTAGVPPPPVTQPPTETPPPTISTIVPTATQEQIDQPLIPTAMAVWCPDVEAREGDSGTVRVVYIDQDGTIWRWDDPETGTAPILVEKETNASWLLISPDGERIIYNPYELRHDELWMVNVDGTEHTVLLNNDALNQLYSDSSLADHPDDWYIRNVNWLPGTQQIVLSLGQPGMHGIGFNASPPANSVYLVDTSTGQTQALISAGQAGDIVVSPDGRWLAVLSMNDLRIVQPQGDIRTVNLPEYETIFTGNDHYTEYYEPPIMWSADSQRFWIAVDESPEGLWPDEPTAGIYEVPVEGEPIKLFEVETSFDLIYFAPDGRRLAWLDRIDNSTYESELHIVSMDGTDNLVFIKGESYIFRGWSPDGSRFAYQVREEEPLMVSNGCGETYIIGEGDLSFADWISPQQLLWNRITSPGSYYRQDEWRLVTLGEEPIMMGEKQRDIEALALDLP